MESLQSDISYQQKISKFYSTLHSQVNTSWFEFEGLIYCSSTTFPLKQSFIYSSESED